jgi:exodeoxyribonuclease V alpha subunit
MARTLTASSTEVLAGLVDRVTFHNSENGFCVLRVKARGQRDLITLVGHAAMISAGEFVRQAGPGPTTVRTASSSEPRF